MGFVICPKCNIRVLPRADGTCPSCQVILPITVDEANPKYHLNQTIEPLKIKTPLPLISQSSRPRPFLFSSYHRYFLLVFLCLAIIGIGPILFGRVEKAFYSTSSIIGLAFPLATIYWFWSSVDTIIWLRKKPGQFFKFAKLKEKNRFSRFFSEKPNIVWFYTMDSIMNFVLGVVGLVTTISAIIRWIS